MNDTGNEVFDGSNTIPPSSHQEFNTESGFDTGALYTLVGTFLLLPFFFLPFVSSPFQFTKIALILCGTLVAFILFVIARLKEGSIFVPLNLVIMGAWLIPFVYFLSALFSPSSPLLSFMGRRFETDTVFFVVVGALILTLVPLIIRSKQQILGVYSGLLLSFLIITLYQGLRLIFGFDFLAFDIFTTTTANIIGKWNDLGIFFGITTILSFVTLEGLTLHNVSKAILYAILVLSLIFLGIINFTPIWIVLGVFALGFFVYNLLKKKFVFTKPSQDMSALPNRNSSVSLSVASFLVLLISLLFVVGGDRISEPVNAFFNINQIEVRPTWESTMAVIQATYATNLLLGSGPNTFDMQWARYKPSDINNSTFWNVNFNTGIGFIPSSFATTGILGGGAWVLFLALLIFSGIRALLLRPMTEDSFAYYLSLSSFLVALYLWVFTVIYIPNSVMLAFAFFFSGLYLASLRHLSGEYKEKHFIFSHNPRLGFVSVLGFTVLLVFAGVGVYLVGNRYMGATYFQRAVVVLNTQGDEIETRRMINKAESFATIDLYTRLSSELELRKLSRILSDEKTPVDERRSQFEETLSSAIKDAQLARDISPLSYQNWFSLGRVYQSVVPLEIQGSYENAKLAYEKALELSPHNPLLFLSLAELEVLHADNTSAREYIRRALEEKNNYTAAVFLLAQIQVNENQIPEAIQSVEAATLLEPNNAVILFQLGLLKYNQGDYTGAIKAFEKAVAINTAYANARYFLGLSYYRLGRLEDAIGQFEGVAKTNPDNAEVKQILVNLRAGAEPLSGINAGQAPEDRNTPPIEGE